MQRPGKLWPLESDHRSAVEVDYDGVAERFTDNCESFRFEPVGEDTRLFPWRGNGHRDQLNEVETFARGVAQRVSFESDRKELSDYLSFAEIENVVSKLTGAFEDAFAEKARQAWVY